MRTPTEIVAEACGLRDVLIPGKADDRQAMVSLSPGLDIDRLKALIEQVFAADPEAMTWLPYRVTYDEAKLREMEPVLRELETQVEALRRHIIDPDRSLAFNRHHPPGTKPHCTVSAAGAWIAAWAFLYRATGRQKYLDWAAEPRLAKALNVRENGTIAFTAGEVDLREPEPAADDKADAKDKEEDDAAPKPVTRRYKVGVKMIFPIFLLIMPTVFLVTAGPAVILLLTNLTKMISE